MAVNNGSWIEEWERKRDEINEQVMLFIDSDCQEDCRDMYKGLYASVGDNARLDIYFTAGATSDDIGQWASFMKIPPEEVRQRHVTLNFDEGKSTSLNINMDSLPQVRVVDIKTGTVTATYK